jgi:hypothetical protein
VIKKIMAASIGNSCDLTARARFPPGQGLILKKTIKINYHYKNMLHQNENKNMSFFSASMLTHLVQSETFWGELKLGSLGMLASTCKGFRLEIFGNLDIIIINKKNKSKKSAAVHNHWLIEQALLAMVSARPSGMNEWALRFTEAKYRFSLSPSVLVKHCMALPDDDVFHLTAVSARLFNNGYINPGISFIDAFRLAATCSSSSCGLKAAMQRRHALDVKVKESAYELSKTMRRPIRLMIENTQNARDELDKTLVQLRKDTPPGTRKYVTGESDLRKGARLLKQLSIDLRSADNHSFFMRIKLEIDHNNRDKIKVPKLERQVRELKKLKASVVARYKDHGERYCPVIMTEECLEGLE